MDDSNEPRRAATPLASYVWVAVLCGAIGFASVYAMRGGSDKSADAEGRIAQGATPAGNSLASGDMITFVFKKEPELVPTFKFQDGEGHEKTLADWKGKVVLLNVWATWCAPCRREMPALDRLQKEMGGEAFEVVALSVDRQGAPASRKFLEKTKATGLKLYVESTSKSIGVLRASGLPTTLLIDREGREVGRLAGPAEWDGADAKKLIASVLK